MKIKAKILGEVSTAYQISLDNKLVWISKDGIKNISEDGIELTETVYSILKSQGLIKEEKKEEKKKEDKK